MANWMKVNQQTINAPLDDSRVGVDLQVFVSPYDIPVAIRGGYDQTICRFVIELQYESPAEKLGTPDVAEHIQFFSGSESGRLYKVVLDVDSINANTVQFNVIVQRVEHAIDQLWGQRPRPRNRRNYIAARRAISQLPALAGR